MEHRDLLAVGKAVKAFGVGGDIIVLPMTDNPARFRRLKHTLIGLTPDEVMLYDIEKAAVQARGVRMKLRGVDNRNDAERLAGKLLFVEPEQCVRLPKGRFFVHDVIGMSVVDDARGNVGTVCDVIKMPANDIFVVAYQGKEYMVPAVREFIRRIDPNTKEIAVRLIDGMLNEDSAEIA